MTILDLIWGRFYIEYAAWCCINLFGGVRRLLYYHWVKQDQLWSGIIPLVWPQGIQFLHRMTYLPQSNSPIWCQIGVDVGLKRHDLGPTDTTQTPVGLIHIHIMKELRAKT